MTAMIGHSRTVDSQSEIHAQVGFHRKLCIDDHISKIDFAGVANGMFYIT